jgi:predicted amidohydrolase YtcJ
VQTSASCPPVLVRSVRLVPVGRPAPQGPVDLRLRDGVVQEVGRALAPRPDEQVLEADGRWVVPGLWDAHVHLQTWARSTLRLDLSGTSSADQAVALVAAHLAGLPGDGSPALGYGHRTATWARTPTVAELDAVCGDRAVALISGDGHAGWLSSRALERLGLAPRTGPVEEAEWFEAFTRLDELGPEAGAATALETALVAAARLGVVGLTDMEWEAGPFVWPSRMRPGTDLLRVRTATYADGLDTVLAAGLRTGTPLEGTDGIVTMGPLKVIFDGSLNTRTAWCCAPHAGSNGTWTGMTNLSPGELTDLCRRATEGGLDVAVHAIGDAAVAAALDAVEASGARGSLEHVQLLADTDLPRFAALGVRASVQPAHLLDDRDVTAVLWPDRQARSFALRSLLDAGADLRLGSDAPVARLDPWLAMAAAVHRTGDEREPWTPEQSLTPAEALAASTDGQRTPSPGSPADLVLLDADPLAPAPDPAAAAEVLCTMRVAATLRGGRLTHDAR